MLTVSDGLALDSVQPIQVRSQGDEYKKTAYNGGYKNEYLNTSYGASLLSLHGQSKRFSLLSGLFSFHSTAQAKAIESKSEQLAVLNILFHGGNRTCFLQLLFQGKQLFSDVISEQSRRLGIPVRTVNGLHLPDIVRKILLLTNHPIPIITNGNADLCHCVWFILPIQQFEFRQSVLHNVIREATE